MDFNRLILFGALGMVLMLLWQSWQEYVAEKNPVTQSSSLGQLSNTTATSAQVPTEGVPQTPKGSQDSNSSVSQQDAVPLTQSLPGGSRVIVETDLIKAEIDTNGGDLRRFELLDYPVSLDEMDIPFTLLNDVGADLFILSLIHI